MTQPPPRPARPPAPGGARRRRVLVPTLVVLAVLAAGVSLLATVGTEVLWYRQAGYGRVYATRLITQVLLFVIGGGLMAGAVAVSLSAAYRNRPLYAPVTQAAANLDRYRESLEPLRRVVLVVLPVLLGLFAGSAAAGRWQTVLEFLHRTPFGATDTVFGLDIGFYVFTLPFLRFAVGLVTAVVLLALITGAATHYLYGGLRLQGPGPRTTGAARVHLASLASLLILAQAASYWLDRYTTLTNTHRVFVGAGYTDVHVVIPARGILAIIAVLCAVLFAVAAVRGGWRFPLAGTALLVVSAIVAAGVLPAAIQRFTVLPSEANREAPYIQRNIAATRAAYDVAGVKSTSYQGTSGAQPGALAQDAATTASIRVLDPAIVSPTFRQKQQKKPYYQFASALDVDRYQVSGANQDTVIAAREINEAGLPSQGWLNRHAIYTHGYGVVAAAGNKQASGGLPFFIEQDIPATGDLDVAQPRIYFGEQTQDYSVVGAPTGSKQVEIDYPDSRAGGSEAHNTYDADGGPSIGNLFTRLLYAVKFRDANLVLSDAVNAKSQILYDRTPRERVEKVAPFLTLDGDPYPAVVGGKVVWIVDGYTTSSEYPYSQPQQLSSTTADSLTSTRNSAVSALPPAEVNYIRNSVKATVDAYTGKVTLYAWEPTDPVLKTWEKVFPDEVKPLADISGELMAHVRYPEDLFKVQRQILASYHVTQATSFFSGGDFWQVPNDPTKATASSRVPDKQPPYFLTLQMPTQDAPAFSLTSTYIPVSGNRTTDRDVLTGFLAVDADAGSSAGQKASGYGTLRLLNLPSDGNVAGPGQVQNTFNTDPTVSTELNILGRGDSRVERGNLLTLPVAGGLLYVQPVYVVSTGNTAYPTLQKVLVQFSGSPKVGFEDTLDASLDAVFGGDSGAPAGDAGSAPSTSPSTSPSGGATGGGTAPSGPSSDLSAALADADQAYKDGQAALAQGDFAAYGQAQTRLQAAISRAISDQGGLSTPKPSGSASASPSSSGTASSTAGPSASPSGSASTTG